MSEGWRRVQTFVRELLGEFGYKVSDGKGYDFNAEKGDLEIALEVKTQDISKPHGRIVINWPQIDALMSAVKNGRKSYLFLLTNEEQPTCAVFGLVECWGTLYSGEEISEEERSESPFGLTRRS